jgi:D-sedoheptulose 7-phosphate isomerase
MATNYPATYLSDLRDLVGKLDPNLIQRGVDMLREARDRDRRVYVIGNGGSAAIASQMVVDIGKGASLDRPKRFKVITLTDQIPWITALANDISYDIVFVEQLKNFAERGDVLIGMSCSGTSKNVVLAQQWARDNGLRTIGLGKDAATPLRAASELFIPIPSVHYGRLEDCFFIITHIFCYAFMENPKL